MVKERVPPRPPTSLTVPLCPPKRTTGHKSTTVQLCWGQGRHAGVAASTELAAAAALPLLQLALAGEVSVGEGKTPPGVHVHTRVCTLREETKKERQSAPVWEGGRARERWGGGGEMSGKAEMEMENSRGS